METNLYLLGVPLTEQAACSLSISSRAQGLFSGRSSPFRGDKKPSNSKPDESHCAKQGKFVNHVEFY